MTERRAYVLLLGVILLWAGNFPLGKLGLGELGPVTITAVRAVIAAPMLLLLARLTAPRTRPFVARDYAAFVVLGSTGLVLNTTVWFWGLAHTTALNAGILGAASPIFAAIAAAALLGDRLRLVNWVGIALSVAAVLLTIAKGSIHVLLTLAVNRGDLIILLSQVMWITYSLYGRAAASSLPPVWIMYGAHVVSAMVLVPLSLVIEGPWRSPAAAPLGWLTILYGAVPITLGHLWYYAIIRTIGVGRAAGFLNLMPFAVIALAWALVGEPVHAYHLIGAALVGAGVYLTTR
ncbi:MAG: DMT family transporter [Candidatus Rokubacteria bacterium]|nr:DMT family transporter [Candidatus Rokubacteria bacterium]